MVMEYCDGGNLSSYIQSHGKVEEHIVKRFMKQIGILLFVILGTEFLLVLDNKVVYVLMQELV